MAILHPEELLQKRGGALIIGSVIMILGLVFLALAGRAREHNARHDGDARSGFVGGLVICILSGIFSSMINFSFVFGDELRLHALQAGASNAMAANPIWALTVTGGFVSNLLYCVYLLNKNHTWTVFYEGNPYASWPLGILMGLLWFGGIVLYGAGAASLGSLGSIAGWPILMTLEILVGLFWGIVSGEWKGASRPALLYNWAGTGSLLVAIVVISGSNTK
jgi:L-rhamnose-H+ transport protein